MRLEDAFDRVNSLSVPTEEPPRGTQSHATRRRQRRERYWHDPTGSTSTFVPVVIERDKNVEADENFFVTISDPQNANLGSTTCQITPRNNPLKRRSETTQCNTRECEALPRAPLTHAAVGVAYVAPKNRHCLWRMPDGGRSRAVRT